MNESTGLQILYQRLVLDVSLAKRTIQGACIISARCRKKLDRLQLNAQSLDVLAVRVDGVDSRFELHKPTDLEADGAGKEGKHPVELHSSWRRSSAADPGLVIEAACEEGHLVCIEVVYQVSPASPSTLYSVHPMDGSCTQLIVAAAQGQASHWVPCIDDARTRCKWDLELCIDGSHPAHLEQLFVVGSGALVQQSFDDVRLRKVFNYKLDIAVPAARIGFVVGLFEMHKVCGVPNAHLFTPVSTKPADGAPQPTLASKTGPTIEFLARSFGYLNWLLNTRYPWAGFYLVYCRDPPRLSMSLPNVILLPTAMLHDPTIIDQTWESRQVLCQAIIEQYYFCKAYPGPADHWIVPALCRYLALHQLRVFHGNSDYRLQLRLDLQAVLELETEHHGPLVSSARKQLQWEALHCIVNETFEWVARKGRLVLVLLEQILGKQNIQKILMQIFMDANAVDDRVADDIYSINYLQRCIKRITGKELRGFLEQWLLTSGFPLFDISFAYNRKKSCVEFTVRQTCVSRLQDHAAVTSAHTNKRSPARFTGPLLIRIHETDTAYDHVVHIEDCQHHFELPFHTKLRKVRQSKKQADAAAMSSSQSVPEDGSGVPPSADDEAGKVSPIGWVRIDPEIEWIADFRVAQLDVMWIEQLENDRDVVAQYDAIRALSRLSSESSCVALERSIADFKAFYKVRAAGLRAVARCSRAVPQFCGDKKILEMFARRFGFKDPSSGEVVPRPNNFENLSNYYFLLSVLRALSDLRDEHDQCPEPALQLLTGLLKYNDNSCNEYSDYHYLAEVIACTGRAFANGCVNQGIVEEVLRELDRFAFLDRILPSHRNAVMSAVLEAWCALQVAGLASFPCSFYCQYFAFGNYVEVRMAAARTLLRLFPEEAFDLLLTAMLGDPSRLFRKSVGVLLVQEVKAEPVTDFKDRLYAYIQRADASALEQLQQLCAHLYPDQVKGDGLDFVPHAHITLTLPSPSKRGERVPEQQIDWVTEISEGMALTSLRRGDNRSDGFSSASKVPKLRLAIGGVSEQRVASKPLKDRLVSVIDALWDHPDSYPFRHPVDPTVPHYYDIIRHPMDLSSLKQKLEYIASAQDFVKQLRLVFDNCAQFNHQQSMIFAQAKELRKHAVKELKREFPELKGSIKDLLVADLPIQASDLEVFSPHPAVPESHFEGEAGCRKLLSRLGTLPQSFWFLHPVDPVALNVPNYFAVIKEPMDFGTMAAKLESRAYHSVGGFLKDMKRVFGNCYLFNNPSDPVCEDARTLEKVVLEAFPEYAEVDLKSPAASKTASKTASKPVLKLKLVGASKREDRSFEEPCRKVLETIRGDEQSGPFLVPVVGVPGYAKVIRKPMDVGSIEKKLSRKAYPSAAAVKADLDLVWQNCARFNGPDAPITGMARHLASLTEHLFEEFGLL